MTTASPQELRENFSFAFQPIVDLGTHRVTAYEALVRGPNGQSAQDVIGQFHGDDLYRFDLEAQNRAIRLAAKLGHEGHLMINMLNGTLRLRPDAATIAIETAIEVGMNPENLTFEVSEKDQIEDLDTFLATVRPSRQAGVDYALDDFGAGFSGLNLLAGFQPNFIKLDLSLSRDIHRDGPRQAIVRGVLRTCADLAIEVVAEGIETDEEFSWLWQSGVRLFQGYLFARPAFEALPQPNYPSFA